MLRAVVRPLWALSEVNTIPYLFPVTNLALWALGPALFIVSVAGLGYALIKREKIGLFLVAFLIVFYLFIGGVRVPFIRYFLPMVPILAVLAARFLLSVQAPPKWFRLKNVRHVAIAVVVVSSTLYGAAYLNVYVSPDIRLQARDWIGDNIPVGSVIVVEHDIFWMPTRWDRVVPDYTVKRLRLYDLYENSSQHVYLPPVIGVLLRDELVPENNQGPLSANEINAYFNNVLRDADYVVVLSRFVDQFRAAGQSRPAENQYYEQLFDGSAGFGLLKKFEVKPALLGVSLNDDRAQHVFKAFDHPSIWIFKRDDSVDLILDR